MYRLVGLNWLASLLNCQTSRAMEMIDEHVRVLNALRSELAERLVGLDRLREVTDDPHLAAYLDHAAVVPLPHLDEDFPVRLYGT